jgi:radical SAM superfamily enzyme YgiQ (UPF0313 family)
VDILVAATSAFQDPFAQEWQPDLRYTVSFLRSHQIDAGYLYQPVFDSPEQILRQSGKDAPHAIFLELTEENRIPILHFIEAFKKAAPQTLLFVGGIRASLTPGEILEQYREIDYLVIGERELTLLGALRRINKGELPLDVPGIQTKEFTNPRQPLLQDLDLLGNMIHDGLDELLGDGDSQEKTGFLIGSRGCYAHCSFCGVPDLYRTSPGKPWRGRSPQAIVGELQELADKFHLKRFIFQDDNFMGPGRAGQERAQQIARLIMRSGLHIQYYICCRLNDIRSETIAQMKESGLSGMGVSVESMSQDSLNLLDKGIQSASIYPTLEVLEELHMPCQVNLIFFDPYTTLRGVRANLALLENLRRTTNLSYTSAFPYNELNPFPWARVTARLRSEGLLDEIQHSCRFKDPRVGRLADFVRRLKGRLPLTFKKNLLFDSLDSYSTRTQNRRQMEALSCVAAGLRQWIGLTLLPRYLSAACDLLEKEGDAPDERLWKAAMDKLEENFIQDARILYDLEMKISEAINPAE